MYSNMWVGNSPLGTTSTYKQSLLSGLLYNTVKQCNTILVIQQFLLNSSSGKEITR